MSLPHTFFIGRSGGSSSLYDFSSHTFSNAGAFGQLGPTLAMARTAYDPVTLWNDNSGAAGADTAWDLDTALFNMPYDGLQLWTVPEDATYNFDLRGAAGGPAMWDNVLSPGRPQRIYNAEIALEQGQKLLIAIGQRGGDGLNQGGNSASGGGGGTFVCKFGEGAGANGFADNAIKPLLIASGGNGEAYSGWGVNGPHGRSTSALTGVSVTANTPGGSTWIDITKTYGRGGFGGGFNVDWKLFRENFYNYPIAQEMGSAAADHIYHGAALLTDTVWSISLNNKYWGAISSRSLRGGNAIGQSSNVANNRTLSGSAYGFGGFGGGGGSKHEGGGGGGYHGGATSDTNQTSTNYAYGASSYISSSINAGSVQDLYSTPSASYLNSVGHTQNTEPFHQLMGSCTITKI